MSSNTYHKGSIYKNLENMKEKLLEKKGYTIEVTIKRYRYDKASDEIKTHYAWLRHIDDHESLCAHHLKVNQERFEQILQWFAGETTNAFLYRNSSPFEREVQAQALEDAIRTHSVGYYPKKVSYSWDLIVDGEPYEIGPTLEESQRFQDFYRKHLLANPTDDEPELLKMMR